MYKTTNTNVSNNNFATDSRPNFLTNVKRNESVSSVRTVEKLDTGYRKKFKPIILKNRNPDDKGEINVSDGSDNSDQYKNFNTDYNYNPNSQKSHWYEPNNFNKANYTPNTFNNNYNNFVKASTEHFTGDNLDRQQSFINSENSSPSCYSSNKNGLTYNNSYFAKEKGEKFNTEKTNFDGFGYNRDKTNNSTMTTNSNSNSTESGIKLESNINISNENLQSERKEKDLIEKKVSKDSDYSASNISSVKKMAVNIRLYGHNNQDKLDDKSTIKSNSDTGIPATTFTGESSKAFQNPITQNQNIGNFYSTFNQNVTSSTNNLTQPQGVIQSVLNLSKEMGYPIAQKNGQRTFGPHPDDMMNKPGRGCEIFVGKIPRAIYEDELMPLFMTIGKIYMMRLMMDFDGRNRGYCFITFFNRYHAKEAIEKFNNYEIRKSRFLGVCSSVDNCRLFIGGIPKCKSRNEIKQEVMKCTEGVKDVLVYPAFDSDSNAKNRGFAFIEYRDHRSAAMARRKLAPGRILLFNTQIAVDWAEPEDDLDEEIMQRVKILYVRNIPLDITEEELRLIFEKFGTLERVKKIRDYAFVHFMNREDALKAIDNVNGQQLKGQQLEVTLAKPVVDKHDSTKMTIVGAKALAAAQAGVDPEALLAAQTASYLLAGGNTDAVPDVIQNDSISQSDWKYLAKMYPTKSGKGRAALRSCYLGYSAGKATYGRYYTKNHMEKTSQLISTMQKEVFTRLETAVQELANNLQFGQYKVTVEDDKNGHYYGKIYFFNISQSSPAYVTPPVASSILAKRTILEQTVTGLSSIWQNFVRQQTMAQAFQKINSQSQRYGNINSQASNPYNLYQLNQNNLRNNNFASPQLSAYSGSNTPNQSWNPLNINANTQQQTQIPFVSNLQANLKTVPNQSQDANNLLNLPNAPLMLSNQGVNNLVNPVSQSVMQQVAQVSAPQILTQNSQFMTNNSNIYSQNNFNGQNGMGIGAGQTSNQPSNFDMVGTTSTVLTSSPSTSSLQNNSNLNNTNFMMQSLNTQGQDSNSPSVKLNQNSSFNSSVFQSSFNGSGVSNMIPMNDNNFVNSISNLSQIKQY